MTDRKRPVGVTILAILAGLAAIMAIFHTLQMLYLFPIRGPFGLFRFFTFNPLGAVLWVIMAAIYAWLVGALWNVDPQAWLFLAVASILNLVLDGVSLFGGTPWQALLPSFSINSLILIYCLLPGTREAFGTDESGW